MSFWVILEKLVDLISFGANLHVILRKSMKSKDVNHYTSIRFVSIFSNNSDSSLSENDNFAPNFNASITLKEWNMLKKRWDVLGGSRNRDRSNQLVTTASGVARGGGRGESAPKRRTEGGAKILPKIFLKFILGEIFKILKQ